MDQHTLVALRPRIEAVVQRVMPGAVIAVSHGGQPPEQLAVGTDGRGQPLTVTSLFPVASNTKLATALSLLRLVDAGAVHDDDRLALYVPESAAAVAGVTLRMLFTHTAGLQGMEDELAPWTLDLTWSALTEAALHVAPSIPPGTRVAYSDIDYVLLAMVIERVTGMSFPVACHQLVLDPLGIEGYLGEEPPRQPAWIADEPGPHTGTPLEWHNSTFFRSLGLPASGLVTTAAGALALVQAFAGTPEDFLRAETRAAATRDQTGGLGGGILGALDEPEEYPTYPWGFGPELRVHRDPHSAPTHASAGSFGHGGSSGCITWADPAAGIAWSILGTRHMAAWWGDPALGEIGGIILDEAT